MDTETKQLLRKLPAIHTLLQHPDLKEWAEKQQLNHTYLSQMTGTFIENWRQQILSGDIHTIPPVDDMINSLMNYLDSLLSPHLRRVINGTGVVLHTNLGRAVLSDVATNHVIQATKYYSNLEYRVNEGTRGSRHDHVEQIICQLTGAEAAMVVNNNAAAVFLVLRELAKGREVVVSRGQLVEIGGSFRISEIMSESGALLVEVGTTNKTHVRDYTHAITENTALLLKVHTSNFKTIGFTHSVSAEELVSIGKEYGIPVYEDLGSGVLFDLRSYGIGEEPTVKEIIQAGVDLVSFSGDKLLGGPQAGIIAGKKEYIQRLKRNQLARVLRVDKMTLAGLEATLKLYLDPNKAVKEIPTLRSLFMTRETIKEKGQKFIHLVSSLVPGTIEMEDGFSEVGGGTLPGVSIPTCLVSIHSLPYPIYRLERELRRQSPPLIGRVSEEKFLIDFRTIPDEEIQLSAQVFIKALESLNSKKLHPRKEDLHVE
ncbi:L-seryl-tRNA(Sec) selenium transferase [Microaerobacter geothermalis]|uniref:L-seryl-tRNA(Sec) selenium transferase n=1 Tax=Microaerobacter geothermalis TaxID=674972 RepID=UPI001F1835FC|nr:L-seryl-tRNA(Sec) selenium transferase [Microaerobacter geothermalis]MCF6094150.1 L-seryl-tRNA(Sec) selenium transferase [Microaerobacter geothermalis]